MCKVTYKCVSWCNIYIELIRFKSINMATQDYTNKSNFKDKNSVISLALAAPNLKKMTFSDRFSKYSPQSAIGQSDS